METYLEDRVYLLQDREGDFVSKVTSTGLETTKLFFEFTKDKEKAKRFSFDDLFSRLATTSVGIEFSRGFAGRLIQIK